MSELKHLWLVCHNHLITLSNCSWCLMFEVKCFNMINSRIYETDLSLSTTTSSSFAFEKIRASYLQSKSGSRVTTQYARLLSALLPLTSPFRNLFSCSTSTTWCTLGREIRDFISFLYQAINENRATSVIICMIWDESTYSMKTAI